MSSERFTGSAMATAEGVMDMVQEFDDNSNGARRGNGNGNGARPAQPSLGSSASRGVRPTNLADPAYSQVGEDIVFDTLRQLLTGGDGGGVGWDKARGQGNGDPKSSSSFLRSMLDDAKQSFRWLAKRKVCQGAGCGRGDRRGNLQPSPQDPCRGIQAASS